MMDYIKTQEGWKPNVPKSPKSGRGQAGVHGGGTCKHICDSLEKTRPYRTPYKNHVFCTRCHGTQLTHGGVWMEKEALKENGRCPCCNFRPRTRSKH
jgi:hypothetical protein